MLPRPLGCKWRHRLSTKHRSLSVRRRSSQLRRCCCQDEVKAGLRTKGEEYGPIELPLILDCANEFPGYSFCGHLNAKSGSTASEEGRGIPTGVELFVRCHLQPLLVKVGPLWEIGNYPSDWTTRRNVISSHDSSPPLLLPVLRSPRHPFHGTQECLLKVPIRSHPQRSQDHSSKPNRLAKG